MSRNSYCSESKTRAALEVLREEKTLDEIAAEKTNPNMLRNWKREFLDKARNLSDTRDPSPILEPVKNVIAHYGTPAIINSDQGIQFTSVEYKQFIQDLHIRQSMDEKTR